MLNIITYKEITKKEILTYRKQMLGIYDKTLLMKNAAPGRYYYSLDYKGCSCSYYKEDPGNGYLIVELFKECIESGDIILFFFWDDGDYKIYENDVYKYINKTPKRRLSFNEFFYSFLTKSFNGKEIVYLIEQNKKGDQYIPGL